MADKLSVSHTEALNEASVLRAQEEIRFENKLQDLVANPPGFDPGQVTPELRAQMGELAQRLQGLPLDLSAEEATTMRRDRLPTDQSLEIISHSLALATQGNGVHAQEALASLMNRPFADMVPMPFCDFNGDEIKPGTEWNDNSPQKRTASLLAACPSGGELLQRLVQPGPVPTRQLQDAVAVYFRATNAIPGTLHVPSKDRLVFAEQAAKILAHPEEAVAPLTRMQRVSFNAVRNGFLSIEDGSPYQIANAAIEKLADHWVTRGQSGAYKTSPLHARQREAATKVAADLGFPTNEAKLNARLMDACDELQKLIAHELVDARTRVGLARERIHTEAMAGQRAEVPQDTGTESEVAAPPEVPDALLLAQNLLQHIRARAEGGERIDTLALDNRVWRAVNKETQRAQQREMKSTTPLDQRTLGLRPQGAAPLDERLLALRRQATEADAPDQPLGEQPDFNDLEYDLWAMQFEKPTVLQALTTLRDRLTRSGTVDTAPTGASANRAGPGAAAAPDQAAPDPILAAAQAELEALELDLDPRPSATGIDLNQHVQQLASPDWTRPGASPNQARASAVSPPEVGSDDDDLLHADAAVDPRPRTRLDEALSAAAAHQAQINCFKSRDGQFSPEALEQWMTPALLTPSGGSDFGAITFTQGRQRGLGTSGLVGFASQVATLFGLVVRPELDGVRGRRDQFRFVRDAYGMGMVMGRTREGSFSLGGSVAVARPLGDSSSPLTGGPSASLIHTWATSHLQGGAVIRVPKFDRKTGAAQSAELSQVLSTALTWREPVKDGGGQLYDSALEALLDRHSEVSVTTVDSARTSRHTANANLLGFLGLGGPVGHAGGFASLASGVTSSNTQETRTSKHTGGTQSIQQQSKLANHIQGVTAGVFGRLGYVDPGQPRLAGVRANLLSVGATADLRLSSALSGSTLVRQPDGSIVGQRTIEYSSFKKFEAAVNLHREKWIEEGIRFAGWPETLPLADKRILSERALDDFMAKAKASLEAGTVTLNETMDIKPAVAAQLNANLALEELARLGKRYDDALALKAVREEILAQDSSYQPFFLLPTARSSINGSTGLNAGLIATETHGANASRLYDYFPRMTTPAI